MHNIDRTNLESSYGQYPGEYETGGYEFENGYEYEYETYGGYEMEGPFSEAEEMELAAELLSVSSEAELDQFFGKIFRKLKQKVGGFLKAPTGKALVGALKNVAKQALPAVGNAILPGAGGVIGGILAGQPAPSDGDQVAAAADEIFGMELEGLSQEDQEFEVARQVVRLAGEVASNAAQANPSTPPQQAAQAAFTAGAQKHAPGLINGAAPSRHGHKCSHKAVGQWVRRGNTIIIYGA
jgi:hypothetical protein